jgi:hypothetical protein
LGFNIYQWSTNSSLTQQSQWSLERQEMLHQLTATQSKINNNLVSLDGALQTACHKLSTAGLSGTQARTILSELVSNNSLIVNAATADVKDVLVAVEPSNYSSIEGQDISLQEQNIQLHQSMRSAMSNMIPLVEGFPGVVMVAPIFDVNGKLTGSLSIVVQPSLLVQQSITPAPEGITHL